MKKIFTTFMLIAAAALAFSSCNKDNLQGQKSNDEIVPNTVFHITASPIDTRTVFGGKVGNAYPTKWTKNKKVRFAVVHDTAKAVDVTPSFEGDGASAIFEPEFDKAPESGTIYAFSPVGDFTADPKVPGFTSFTKADDANAIYVTIPSAQTPLAGSVDESAQAMAASQTYTDVEAPINMSFHHIVAYGKMIISNFTGTIKSVELQFPVEVAGLSCKYVYETGVIATGLDSKTITLDATNVTNNTFWFALAPTAGNTGEMKIIVTDNNNDTYTKTIDLTAKALPFNVGEVSSFTANFDGIEKSLDYVTLPWEWKGGASADFTAVTGVTASGLGSSDYGSTHSPYNIKMDNTGDYITIKTDSPIGVVSIGVKMIGGATSSSFKIQGSADGTNYTDVQTLTISGLQNSEHTLSTTSAFDPSYRYVKAVFTKGSNVGVGPISISKPDTTPTILANDISGVAAAGVINEEGSYVAKNFTDDVEVTAITGCVTEAIADGGKLVYTVAPNYSGAAANGTIVLCSAADNSITKIIAVSQLADKFKVNETSLLLGNPANSSKTFKVTSTYAVTITNPNSDKISISPSEIEAGAEDIVVTVTALAQNMSEDEVDEIGNIVITRSTDVTDENKTKSIAVSQDVKPAAGVVSYTLSFPDDNSTENKVQDYLSDWTATIGDMSWTISKFNNNKWAGGWNFIRGGNKTSASVCTITTSAPIADKITKVIVTVDSFTSGKITSTKLYVASDNSFKTDLQTVDLAVAQGKMTYVVPAAVANSYYKLEYTCGKGSSNGLIQISSVEYTTAPVE